jgi:hypothetical protein
MWQTSINNDVTRPVFFGKFQPGPSFGLVIACVVIGFVACLLRYIDQRRSAPAPPKTPTAPVGVADIPLDNMAHVEEPHPNNDNVNVEQARARPAETDA